MKNVNEYLYKMYIVVAIAVLMSSCYSFTGGSLPEHLETIYIANVLDNSGYGNPTYKDNLQELLIEQFNRDGSVSVSDRRSDCKLDVTITAIKEQSASISAGDYEKERKIVISVNAIFYDNVEKKTIAEKKLSAFALYDVQTVPYGRDEAVETILKQLSEDILFAIVSGW